jgi:pyruvate,water dikinase
MSDPSLIRWFEDLTNQDIASVGGKNASLGEMIRTLEQEGIRVPAVIQSVAEAEGRRARSVRSWH